MANFENLYPSLLRRSVCVFVCVGGGGLWLYSLKIINCKLINILCASVPMCVHFMTFIMPSIGRDFSKQFGLPPLSNEEFSINLVQSHSKPNCPTPIAPWWGSRCQKIFYQKRDSLGKKEVVNSIFLVINISHHHY